MATFTTIAPFYPRILQMLPSANTFRFQIYLASFTVHSMLPLTSSHLALSHLAPSHLALSRSPLLTIPSMEFTLYRLIQLENVGCVAA